MTRAFELAQKGCFTTTPNPNVGCVIVNNGKIVGEGYHKKAGDLHAEIYALRMAKEKSKGSTVYVTLEPCSYYGRTPPCVKALIDAGISRIVIASKDPNPQVFGNGIRILAKAGIEIINNFFLKKYDDLNRGFFKRMRTGFPYVQLKLASSLDAKTSLKSGESKWITGIESRKDVQLLRAKASAILTTSKTVISDNPSLTVRWNELPKDIQKIYQKKELRQPIRIVLDNKNIVTPNHKITQLNGECWLIRSCLQTNIIWKKNIQQSFISFDKNGVNLIDLMKYLGKQNINTLLVEAGSTLASSLLKFNLFDELIIYIAPKFLGDEALNLVNIPMINNLDNAVKLKFIDIKKIGDDLRVILSQP
ncbi:Riboflavin biosynthesis protein RibD [Candidatus Providencia siddallii]|uniref:Riboflavin biosynthesis protein RibD n=1 Tax=Candidatus Providencia siddallii TaxID=1715285 RepID=A0A0M6W850_9GAMM|nr:Riboflavin biosynthesis protein RibD [Candidatus Providencia siddallii]